MTVAEIQRALLARGYDIGRAGVDGDAGPDTIAAVTAFQRSAGLVPDGIAGPLTQKALREPAKAVASRKAQPAEPAWLTLARGELGTVEGVGKSNNPKVVRYFADAGFAGIKDDEVAWCAAFVGAGLVRAGRKASGSLAARSYEKWGVGLQEPRLGAIGVKKRATRHGRATWVSSSARTARASSCSAVIKVTRCRLPRSRGPNSPPSAGRPTCRFRPLRRSRRRSPAPRPE